MAQFYLDLFARPGDKVHVGMLNVVASRSSVFSTEKTPVRLPVLALLLNQSPPTDDHPTLMTFTDVHALFHSFGMVLRFALTDAKYTMTYKWAEVQALDAYTCFTETEGDQSAWNATGRRFRRTFLAMTGVCHPSQVFESFCGRQHNTDAMLRHYGLKMCP
ncbi:hypothetical protein DYB36_009506 [Aphanomyces astaci]|uniref:Peptidase M3A/M3B catalytic domain-containing protein n=1 Tax=Aphanomyces astaci TaxID=112090 RepID=A0A397BKH3_APHAT|nr:hypothetical protein DYB36_009506 [Aphanomyces astaci]RHZ22511.1 hypothetical protein DYB31_004987 [Aphanomyces astaci]